MSKAARSGPELDQDLGTTALADPHEASITLLQTVEIKQHALMSAWGGAFPIMIARLKRRPPLSQHWSIFRRCVWR